MSKKLDVIGRAERIEIRNLGLKDVPAKIDTGADGSTIWASKVSEQSDGLLCVFFGPGNEYYTGEEIVFPRYKTAYVENSFGVKEQRYKVKLNVTVKGRLIRASFTLSDRAQKTYPILLGRRLLKDKFLVDVSQGEPLSDKENQKSMIIQEKVKPETFKRSSR